MSLKKIQSKQKCFKKDIGKKKNTISVKQHAIKFVSSDFLWNQQDLKIQKSKIPNAGKGLFANRKFNLGEIVVGMLGPMDLTRCNNSTSKKIKLYPPDAFIEIHDKKLNRSRPNFLHIFDLHFPSLWYFMNHGPSNVKMEIVWLTPNKLTFCWRATHIIQKNDELLFNYQPGKASPKFC